MSCGQIWWGAVSCRRRSGEPRKWLSEWPRIAAQQELRPPKTAQRRPPGGRGSRRAGQPREGEAPAEPATPREGEAPAEPANPWEGQAPAEPANPWEGEAPAEPANPAREGEAPAEPPTPWEGEAPAEPATPREGEAPAEPANPLGGRGSRRAGNPSGGRGSCRAVGFSSQAAVRLSGSFALPKGQHPWQCNLQLRTGFRVDPFFAPQTAPRRAQQERKHSRRFSSVEFSEGNAGEGNAKAPPRRSAFCRKWRQRTFRSQPQMIPCTTVPGCPSSRLPVPLARRNVCCSCPSPNRCSSVA